MQRPGFWDDQDTAARTSAAHASAQRKLTGFRELEADADDLEEIAEMSAGDDELAGELATQIGSVEERLAELEEARLFSGEYDDGDAVVTVHAGAGGTDSQDWAEILLRMYLRWAERRGFEVEMKEEQYGNGYVFVVFRSACCYARGADLRRLGRLNPEARCDAIRDDECQRRPAGERSDRSRPCLRSRRWGSSA